MDAFPVMKSNGWETKSVALLSTDTAYQNSDGTGDSSTVTPDSILLSTDDGENGDDDDGDDDGSSSNSGSGAGAGAGSGTTTHTRCV